MSVNKIIPKKKKKRFENDLIGVGKIFNLQLIGHVRN